MNFEQNLNQVFANLSALDKQAGSFSDALSGAGDKVKEYAGKGVKAVGEGAKAVGKKVGEGVKKVKDTTVAGAKAVGEGAKSVGKSVSEGAKKVKDTTVEGAKAVGGAASGAASGAGNALKRVGYDRDLMAQYILPGLLATAGGGAAYAATPSKSKLVKLLAALGVGGGAFAAGRQFGYPAADAIRPNDPQVLSPNLEDQTEGLLPLQLQRPFYG